MPKIVVKFGGSNLRSNEEIHRIVQVIKNYNQPLIVVVSAFYGVTNYLVDALPKPWRIMCFLSGRDFQLSS